MRMSHLFVVLIGVMPTLAFTTTLWLTDGAPFRPLGPGGAQAPSGDRRIPAVATESATGRIAGPSAIAAGAARESNELWMRQALRAGDTDAAILLTILENPRGLGVPRERRESPQGLESGTLRPNF